VEPDWTQERIESFVLDGTSTSRRDLVRSAQRLRRASDARWLIMLVFYGDRGVRLLHSATTVATADPDLTDRIAAVAHDLVPHRRVFPHDALQDDLARARPRLGLLREAIAGSHAASAVRDELIDLLAQQGPVAGVSRALGRNFPRQRVVLVAGTTVKRLESSEQELRQLIVAAATSQTIQSFETVSTAERIDDQVTAYEREFTDRYIAGPAALRQRLQGTERRIVELAREATSSEQAVLWDLPAGAGRGRLEPRVHRGVPRPEAIAVPDRESSAAQEAPIAGFTRRRPLIANSEDDYQQLNLQATDDAHPVLVVPIPRPLDQSPADPIGVLVLGRARDPFRVVDLQLARIAAMRIAHARLQHLLVSLTQARLRFRTEGGQPIREAELGLDDAPPEWRAQAPLFTTLLKEAHEVFGCRSISLRVQSLDGRSLVRLVASPPDRLHERGTSLQMPRSGRDEPRSVVADACRRGETIQVLDADRYAEEHPDGWYPVTDDVGSALCVPVFAMGRICGTLNIEIGRARSPEDGRVQPFAQPFQAVALELAETCGAGLDAATASAVSRAQSVAFGTAIRFHQIKKSLEEIRGQLGTPGTETVDESAVSSALRRIEPLLRSPFVERRGARSKELRSLIRSCVREAKIVNRTEIDLDEIGCRLSSLVVQAAHYPLVELFLNAATASQNQYPAIRVRGEMGVWAGSPCCFLEISNPVAGRIDPAIAQVLYRSAVQRTAGGWGAYLAAEQIRSVGGDVFLAESESRWATTVVRLPVLEPRTRGTTDV
jgi:hypothetical protein